VQISEGPAPHASARAAKNDGSSQPHFPGVCRDPGWLASPSWNATQSLQFPLCLATFRGFINMIRDPITNIPALSLFSCRAQYNYSPPGARDALGSN
jgi:hypothetical protein